MLKFSQSALQTTPFAVSELVIPNFGHDSRTWVYPMLAHLSRKADRRWMSWIGDCSVGKKEIEEYGFQSRKVRLIHCSSTEETLWSFWEALNYGTSDYVVANIYSQTKALDREQLENLNLAAKEGCSTGLLINYIE